jgi:ribulose-phosphate 3-epimerase
MDAHFVPNLTFGPRFVEAVDRLTSLPLITHLMMTDPVPFLPRFARAGVDALIIHVEALPDPRPALAAIRDLGVRAGVSLNPDTPFEAVAPFLRDADVFLVMSVHPGFGGQAFRPEALPKATRAAALRREQGLDVEIHIDGGIDVTTAPAAARAGVDVLVAGSAVFGAPDPGAMVQRLREAASR